MIAHAPTSLRQAACVWTALAVIVAVAMIISVATGSIRIPLAELPGLLFSSDRSTSWEVVHHLRLPRTFAGFATGGLLAISGALMQVLLRNPLADPYVLGLSGGAAVGALVVTLLGGAWLGIEMGAFCGALASVVLVFALGSQSIAFARGVSDVEAAPRLLLVGAVIAAAWSAIITLLLTMMSDTELRGLLYWLIGDLGSVTATALPLATLAIVLAASLALARPLNVLLRGPIVAHSLGVATERTRVLILIIASFAAAVAVTTAGTIGFVGLIVPHALRLMIGNDQRVLLPACALAGGALVVLADTAARSLLAPQQLPVGALMAVIGAPVFVLLLVHRPHR